MLSILLLIALVATGHIEATDPATCTSKKLDLAFIVDGSTSVCKGAWPCPEWNNILQFMKDIIIGLTIGEDDTRVALVTLFDHTQVEWDLTRYTGKASLLTAIDNVKYRGGELQEIVTISDIVLGVFNPLTAGDRLGVQNIGIVITDGVPNFPSFLYAIESIVIQLTRGVGMFVVCSLTGCTEECAHGVASPPQKVNETYFLIDNYHDIDQVRGTLVKNFCVWQTTSLIGLGELGL